MEMKIPFDCDSVRVTSLFGTRVLRGKTEKHNGYDMVGIGSYNIISVCDGKVVQSRIVTDKNNKTWQWGNYVCVLGVDGRYYYYCHMNNRLVKAGDNVRKGDRLGVMGNTGYSFGAHLHFEVRERDGKTPVNPESIIGIPNQIGVYQKKSKLEEDLNVLQKAGIINTPSYWLENAHELQYVPELINKFANYVRRNGV